jgi:hypothetical protein
MAQLHYYEFYITLYPPCLAVCMIQMTVYHTKCYPWSFSLASKPLELGLKMSPAPTQ